MVPHSYLFVHKWIVFLFTSDYIRFVLSLWPYHLKKKGEFFCKICCRERVTEDEDVSPPSAALRYPCSCFNRPATLSPLSGQTCAPPPRAINQQSRSTLPTNTPGYCLCQGFLCCILGARSAAAAASKCWGWRFCSGNEAFPLRAGVRSWMNDGWQLLEHFEEMVEISGPASPIFELHR